MDLLCNMNFFERCNSSVRCLKFMEVKEEEFSIYLRGLVSPSTLGIEIKKRSSNSGQIYILSQDRSLFTLPLSTSTFCIVSNVISISLIKMSGRNIINSLLFFQNKSVGRCIIYYILYRLRSDRHFCHQS